jgi:hypothetical protein
MFRPGMWLGIVLLVYGMHSHAISAEDADRYLREKVPALAGNYRELRAVYYFGESGQIALIGLEQIDAKTFLPKRWLLVFSLGELIGWYYPLNEFPRDMQHGVVSFPAGTGITSFSIEQIGQPLMQKKSTVEFTPWP